MAIATGAVVGEGLLVAIQDGRAAADAATFSAHVLQWTVSSLCLVVLYVLGCSMLRTAEQAREERRTRVQLLQVAASTQLTALRRQIEPHFFFNTLATVRRLNRTDAKKGARLMEDLLRYMRDMLSRSGDEPTTLGQEFELIEAYLRVCEVRMAGRLHYTIDSPTEILCLDVPPLLLATLVENAVKHGIEPLPEGGAILITARRASKHLVICVEDSGAGFKTHSGSGLGLANVRARLRASFGTSASLTFQQRTSSGVIARLVIPVAGV
jgi:LytS/YehU family sensor histidine kinase